MIEGSMHIGLLAMALVVSSVAAGQTQTQTIKVLTFNVLAPSWADPRLYPSSCTNLLASPARAQRTANWLKNNALGYDAIALQETEGTVNSFYKSALGSAFSFVQVNHSDSYWASYITVNPPFSSNGVAIAINLNKYDQCVYVDKPLSGDGNHGVIAICHNKALNRWFRFVSVHLDTDTGGRRGKEASALADYLTSETSHSNYVDVISGDFNADTDSGVINQRFTNQGFTDIGHALGSTANTHPWTSSYNANSQWGIIDHVLVKGLGLTPLAYKVFDNNLFTRYPGTSETNENTRICLILDYTGSDHFPVSGSFTVTP